jgi:hypothetical protein
LASSGHSNEPVSRRLQKNNSDSGSGFGGLQAEGNNNANRLVAFRAPPEVISVKQGGKEDDVANSMGDFLTNLSKDSPFSTASSSSSTRFSNSKNLG